MSNYTVSADVMSDGNKRMMSNVGLINQRYVINLVGNYKQLEVLSNQERIKVAGSFFPCSRRRGIGSKAGSMSLLMVPESCARRGMEKGRAETGELDDRSAPQARAPAWGGGSLRLRSAEPVPRIHRQYFRHPK